MPAQTSVPAPHPVQDPAHHLMVYLVYPAVLGAVLYSFLPYLGRLDRVVDNPWAVGAVLGLLVHFCADYLYTSRMPEYSPAALLIDLGILLCLYSAFRDTDLLDGRMDMQSIAFSLAGVYWCYLLWAAIVRRADQRLALLLVFQGAALLFFGAAGLFDFSAALVVPAIGLFSVAQLFLLPRGQDTPGQEG